MSLPNRSLLTVLLFAVIYVVSCSRTEKQSPERISEASEKNLPAIVPGTESEVPEYNPGQSGWEEEEWSAEVSGSLKELSEKLISKDDWASVADSLCDSGFEGASVSLPRLPETIPSGQVVVFDPETSFKEKTRFSTLLSELFGGAGLSEKIDRSSFKVVGVKRLEKEKIRCNVIAYFAGRRDGVARQAEGQLKMDWVLGSEGMRLLILEGSFRLTFSSLGQFSDVTHASLGGVKDFTAQFYRGQDHWTGRVEMLTGIDVGGWQGVAVADVNGDGLDDLYVAQPGGLPNRLYLHQEKGNYEDRSASSGTDFLDSCHGNLLIDLDNDGDQDLVSGVSDGIIVMENDGEGNFRKRASKILPAAIPYSIAAADYDQDGDLDFFVCCYNRRPGVNRHHLFARPVPYHDANNGGRNAMFRNDGNWSFRDVTVREGFDVNNKRFSYAASWEDYDNDGDLDLYVANDFGRNNLYRNRFDPDRSIRFEDVAVSAGVLDIGPGMSASWGDFNNDGMPDLYVGNMFSSAGSRITSQDRFHSRADIDTKALYRRHARGNSLFKNMGNGTFTDVSISSGVSVGRWAWSSKFGDLNGDGYQDIVVANGFVTQQDSGDL